MTISQAMQQAVSLHMAGRFAEAEPIYRAILAQMPANAHAMNYLGLVLVKLGRKEEGINLLRKSVHADPGVAQFAANLAGALLESGEASAAESAARDALSRAPGDVQSRINLGQALWKQSRRDEALAETAKAIELQPNRADARSQLGLYLLDMGRPQDAAAELSRALHLDPGAANQANLGNAMLALKNFDAAVDLYRKAAALDPQKADYYFNLMLALDSAGRPTEAIPAGRRAVELRPDFFEAWLKLANLLKETSPPDEALAAYRAALALRPDHFQSLHNIGMVEALMGRVRDAAQTLRQAIALSPENLDAASALIFTLNFHPDYEAQSILREHLEWNRRFAQPLAADIRPHENDRNPDRRLRIGYISPDFRKHVLSYYHVPILSHHDHGAFEIFCYSDVAKPDAITHRMRGYADTWREVSGMSDEQVARQVREDRIDILVDLTMHMGGGRPLLFARKPAPVQVAWCYPGTTGNQAIDYRLTDPYSDPPGQFDVDYSERSIRLPDSFFIYDPMSEEPPVNDLPALATGHITFGCLNNFMKVNEGVLDLWAKVLNAVVGSRLILLAPIGSARQWVIERMAVAGIHADRIEFIWRQPRTQYLQTYNRIDISLDTIPYNGHTTSLDSFWMGVPVVTLIGKTVVGRAGWCLACNLNLRELAAEGDQQFVEIASALASDLPRVAKLRAALRQRMRESPLMDGAKFAKGVEQEYRQMWRTWIEQ